jgi:hypothetical protein
MRMAMASRGARKENAMHRSDTLESKSCAECGAVFYPSRDRGFAFGSDAALCFDCAVRRGGRWDELHDRWETDADVGDLAAAED